MLLATGRDGLDEITVTGKSDLVELKNGEITRFTVSPEDFGLPLGNLSDIRISKTEESARIIKDVLYGRSNESAASIVTLNAAAGLYVAGKAADLQEGVHLVQKAISEGVTSKYYESIVNEKENRQYA